MSSDSSLDSQERAEADRRVDEFFPRPSAKPFVTARGFKAITTEEEAALLGRGIMTYYRGHLDSRCCEACDDSLRTSDRYARQKEDLRPVGVQKHKYIDKRRTGCGTMSSAVTAPLDLKTGFMAVKNDQVEKAAAQYDEYVHEKNDKDLINLLQSLIEPLNYASLTARDNVDVVKLMKSLDDYIKEYTDLFFHYSLTVEDYIKELKVYILESIKNVRLNLLHLYEFYQSPVEYGLLACLLLVMLSEFTIREGVKFQLQTFCRIYKEPYRIYFGKMIKQLSKLPVYKEPIKKTAKVKFNKSELEESEVNEQFKKKRKIMDTCPKEVTGIRVLDIYDFPTFEKE